MTASPAFPTGAWRALCAGLFHVGKNRATFKAGTPAAMAERWIEAARGSYHANDDTACLFLGRSAAAIVAASAPSHPARIIPL